MRTRFYFHLVKEEERIPDRTGVELPYETVMSPAVFAVVKEVWPGTADDTIWEGWSVEIADSTGRVVRTITLL